MIGEKFTLMQYSVGAILGLIEAEQFVIPEIQRPFVWKRSQVRDLIDSLYNGYPTGYIITWKNLMFAQRMEPQPTENMF